MDEIVAFLSRMLDADDAVIARNRGNSGLGENGTYPDYQTYGGPDLEAASDYLDQFAPPRMAADVAAKRAILNRAVRMVDSFNAAPDAPWPDASRRERSHAVETIHDLAAAYADHEQFREEWRV